MTERPVGVSDLTSGAAVADYRTRERTVGVDTVVEQYLLPTNERVQTFKGSASSLIIPSTAAIASLFNKTGSGVLVAVRRFTLQNDYTSSTATVRDIDLQPLSSAPTGGSLATPVPWDTAVAASHSANVEFRYAASADDVLSALTLTPGTTQAWTQMHSREISAAEQQRFYDGPMVPKLANDDPVILREGQGLCYFNNGSVPTAGHAHYVVDAFWEEFTIP